jgi:hypothetical protein
MFLSIRRLAGAGLCLAAGLAVVAPSAAQAAPGLTGKQLVTAISPSNALAKTTDAKCPAGKVIISGGAFIDGPATVKLTELRPVPTGNLFRASARNTFGRVSAWKLYVYAICANEPAGYTYISENSTPGPIPQRSAPIACPQGKQILGVGGRAAIEPNRNVTLDWVVPVNTVGAHAGSVAAQGGEPQNWTSTTYAICADNLGATIAGGAGVKNSSSVRMGVASCPAGKLAAVGGAIVTTTDFDEGQIFLAGVYPGATLTNGTVIATEDHDGYPGNWWLNTWAICA